VNPMGRMVPLLVTLAGWAVILCLSFPLFWMLSTAFKPPTELFTIPPRLLPGTPTLANFAQVLESTAFPVYFANSFVVAAATTAVVLVIAVLGAHAMVAFRLPGAKLLARALLFAYLLPAAVLLIPIYLLLARLGLVNTLFSLIVAYTSFVLPFALWLMRSFMESIPRELEAAAMIDGASRLGAFLDVVLPQALPGIITTGVFAFILAWNEYLYALVLINDEARKTLPTGMMSTLFTPYNVEWGMVMAASVLTSLPLMLIFAVLQRYIIQGFGAGAVKG